MKYCSNYVEIYFDFEIILVVQYMPVTDMYLTVSFNYFRVQDIKL